jgi:peroxiredoxin
MLQIGVQAPDFTLEGSRAVQVTLSRRKRTYAVLVFYPKNDTPG